MYKTANNIILIEKNFFNLKKGRRYITKNVSALEIQENQYFIHYGRLYYCISVEHSTNEKNKVVKAKYNNGNPHNIWLYDNRTLKLIVEEEPLIC